MAERYGIVLDLKANTAELVKLPELLGKAEKGAEKLEGAVDEAGKELEKTGKTAEKTGKEIEKIGKDGAAAIKKTEKAANEMGRSTESAFKRFSEGAMAAFASVQLLTQGLSAVRGVASSLKGFSVENMAAYETQLRAETQLGVTLKNQGFEAGAKDRLKVLASSMQNKTMYGDEAFLGGFGELSTYFKSEDALNKMAPLLADYAAGMTGGGQVGYQQMIDLATGLGKAIDGTYDSLRKKGFDTSGLQALDSIAASYKGMQGATTEKEYNKHRENLIALRKEYQDAADKIIAANGEIDESLKVEALGQALESWKGLAEEMAKTPMGQLQQIKNEIGDMREDLGKEMYLALAPALKAIKENMPKIQAFLQSIGDIATQGVAFLIEHQGDILGFLETLTGTLEFIAKHLDELATLFKIAFGIGSAKLIFGLGTALKGLVLNLQASAVAGMASARSIANISNQAGGAIGKLNALTKALGKATTAGQKLAGVAGGAIIGAMTDNPEGDLGTFAAGAAGSFAAGGIYGLAAYSAVQGAKGITGQVGAYFDIRKTEEKNAKLNEKWGEITRWHERWKKSGGYTDKHNLETALKDYKAMGGQLGSVYESILNPEVKEQKAAQKTAQDTATFDAGSALTIDNRKWNSDNTINQENTIGAEFTELGRILRENILDIMERNLRFEATSMEVAAL